MLRQQIQLCGFAVQIYEWMSSHIVRLTHNNRSIHKPTLSSLAASSLALLRRPTETRVRVGRDQKLVVGGVGYCGLVERDMTWVGAVVG